MAPKKKGAKEPELKKKKGSKKDPNLANKPMEMPINEEIQSSTTPRSATWRTGWPGGWAAGWSCQVRE